MQRLEGSGTPVLYIGRAVLKGYRDVQTVVAVWLTTELMTRYQPEGTENLAYSKINARNVRRRCGKLVW